MFQKLIYATLLSTLWICHSWAAEPLSAYERIVRIFAGEEGLSTETAGPNELAQHGYVAVHTSFKSTSLKRGGRPPLDEHELLTPLVAGYDAVPPGFPEYIKKEHFRNIFILMLATRATLEAGGNFFETPERVAAKIQEWGEVPFLAGVDEEEIGRILNFFNFPLIYQSVVTTPQKLNMNRPIHYLTTEDDEDSVSAVGGSGEKVKAVPAEHQRGLATALGGLGALFEGGKPDFTKLKKRKDPLDDFFNTTTPNSPQRIEQLIALLKENPTGTEQRGKLLTALMANTSANPNNRKKMLLDLFTAAKDARFSTNSTQAANDLEADLHPHYPKGSGDYINILLLAKKGTLRVEESDEDDDNNSFMD